MPERDQMYREDWLTLAFQHIELMRAAGPVGPNRAALRVMLIRELLRRAEAAPTRWFVTDPPIGYDAPEWLGTVPEYGTPPPFRVSGRLTVVPSDGDVARHLNAIITAPNPLLNDLGWDGGRPIRTDQPHEHTFTIDARAAGAFWELCTGRPDWLWTAWNAGRAPAMLSRGTAWRTGTYAACHRALHWLYRPAPLTVTRLWDEQWQPTANLTLARDYPPAAKPCDECVAATAPDWLRWVQLMIAPRALQPPRTDFMPHYPNGGRR